MVALQPSQLIAPELTSIRPSGSAVTVGYQRPNDIAGVDDQAKVVGLKRVPFLMPLKSIILCPPATNTLPSASRPCPAQNRSALANEVAWKVLLFGSQIVPRVVLLLASWPHAKTLPVGIRVTWMGRIGQLVIEPHWPTTEGSEAGGVDADARNATVCMIQLPGLASSAVPVYAPVAVTILSSAMSPSGVVMTRFTKPFPAVFVPVLT